MWKLRNIFSKKVVPKNDFSAFFNNAEDDDKKRLLEKVMRKANEDQRKVVEQYDKIYSKTTS